MRSVVITKHGAPDVLQVQERPDPQPGAGELAIEVRAAGINFADVMARVGLYPDAPKPPVVVGYEVAGTVSAVGDGAQRFAVGDRVMAGTRFGGYSERAVAREADVVALPERMSFEEGAAVPVNYLTAYLGLMKFGILEAGERVLIHAAAGGVGIAATQIAKRYGAEVLGTASPGKHDAIRGFGVDHPLDYRKDGWEQGLPSFDLIMDAVGGESARRSYGMLRAGGRLVAFGASSVVTGDKKNLLKAAPQALRMLRGFDLMKQMSDSRTIIGLNMLSLWKDRGTLEPWIAPLRELMESGVVAPHVHEAVPFDRAADAHRIIERRENVGKVVLVP